MVSKFILLIFIPLFSFNSLAVMLRPQVLEDGGYPPSNHVHTRWFIDALEQKYMYLSDGYDLEKSLLSNIQSKPIDLNELKELVDSAYSSMFRWSKDFHYSFIFSGINSDFFKELYKSPQDYKSLKKDLHLYYSQAKSAIQKEIEFMESLYNKQVNEWENIKKLREELEEKIEKEIEKEKRKKKNVCKLVFSRP